MTQSEQLAQVLENFKDVKKNDPEQRNGSEQENDPEQKGNPENSVKETSHLYSFIQKHLVQQEEVPESKPKKILRLSGQGLGTVLGCLAGLPNFEIAQKAGGGDTAGGWIVGLTNSVAIAGQGSWSYFNLLKDFTPQSEEERVLSQNNKLSVPFHIVAHLFSAVLALPTGYMAYLFNAQKWRAGISYLYDYSLEANGFLHLFKKVKAQNTFKFCLKGREKQDEEEVETELLEKNLFPQHINIQQLLIEHLSHKTIPTLLSMPSQERDLFIDSIHSKDNFKVENYLESLLKLTSSSFSLSLKNPDKWKKGHPKLAFIICLCLPAVINVVHNGFCDYLTWKFIYDNSSFAIPMGLLNTIPSFALEIKSTVHVGGALYDSAFYRIIGNPQPSLLNLLYPKASKALLLICIPLAGVTAYVGRYMVSTVLTQLIPQDEPRLSLVIGGFVGPFLFAAYANYSILQDLLLTYVRFFGDISTKKLTLLTQDIEKLTNVVSIAPKEHIKKFTDLPSIQNALFTLYVKKQNAEDPQNQRAAKEIHVSPKKRGCCGVM